MEQRSPDVDVAVVGAGIAGLIAAATLADDGLDVVVLERDRDPGGRLATARIPTAEGEAVFDVGAQFLTVKDGRFRAHVERWEDEGIVDVWFRGSPDVGAADVEATGGEGETDHYPRFRGAEGMRSIVEAVTAHTDVLCGHEVDGLDVSDGRWRVAVRGGAPWTPRAVIVTAPAPQALRLARTSGTALHPSVSRRLGAVSYAPCIAVLARLDAPVDIGKRGALRVGGEPIEWIGESRAKGISAVRAVTVHAGPVASRQWWDEHDPIAAALVLGGARRWLGQEAQGLAVRRWLHSKPDRAAGRRPAEMLVDDPPLAVAGDGLTGGRVEGAAVSGLVAADLVRDRLS